MPSAVPPPPPARLALLLVSAATSGAAALTLELVWGRELALAFGAAQPAVAVALAVFVLGLGLGSRIGGRFADRTRSPARMVARIELAMAFAGPAVSALLLGLPEVARHLPAATNAWSPSFVAVRAVLAALVIVPPAAAMGATFPLLIRAAGPDLPRLRRGLGALYAANTAGGVAGVAAAGFGIVPAFGLGGAIVTAAACHLAAAAAARTAASEGVAAPPARSSLRPQVARVPAALILASGASGALVFAAETVWHRAARLVLANSTTTFTVVLAATLLGLAVGGAVVARRLVTSTPLVAWSRLQLAAAALLAVQAAVLPQLIGFAASLGPPTGWGRIVLPPLSVASLLILPVAAVLGAAWPMLLAAGVPRVDDGGRRVGVLGMANAVGATAGAVAGGFALLPALGFGRTLAVLAASHLALAGFALARRTQRRVVVAAAAAIVIAVAAAPPFSAVMPPSVARGERRVLAYHESSAGTVVVAESPDGDRGMWVDNSAVIGTTYDAIKVVRMLGLLPMVVHPAPERVLVVGFGAGVTAATVAGSPAAERIEVAEIVPAVVAAAPFFEQLNRDVLADPRVSLAINDGRNHLLLSRERYDVITCDPIHPLYGSSPLYSRDFFTLCRRRLRPGGLVLQYLPLHRMPTRELRRVLATFRTAFPDAWVAFGLGHAVLVGGDGELDLDWNRWRRRIADYRHPADLVASALATPAQVAALWMLDPAGVADLAEGPPSTDLFPYLEFLGAEAYRPGLWRKNARLLVEGYRSPLDRIHGIPPELVPDLRRLVAGKRLLLFSLLERERGDLDAAWLWIGRAMTVAGDDPEIRHYRDQLLGERSGGPTRPTPPAD